MAEQAINPERLIGAREIAQLSIEQLAARTGISAADLDCFETGLLVPTPEQIALLSQATGFPPTWFSQPPATGWPDVEQTSLRWH